ncbi:YhcN/YlaJ family sporulation lipoprotein [Bacillus coahuilensis]|uniref:YhcN/YlaJ family sporulation lipoprotein n=1 Tax=Bacillus coahuilensis TaxID=408580 RepID=UPI00018510B1|nr:YhcN/YlaJ family sporulation lipoprotein [Bacillus coahuilensis]
MKRIVRMSMLGLLLVGCQATDEADQSKDPYEPEGVYSNTGHGDDHDQREGPIQEWYDHSIGNEGKEIREAKKEYLTDHSEGEYHLPPSKLGDEDQGFFIQDQASESRSFSYHGHDEDIPSKAKSSYYKMYQGELVEAMSLAAEEVKSVQSARCIVYGDAVIMGLLIDGDADADKVKTDVRNQIRHGVGDRTLYIDDNVGYYSRIKVIDNQLRQGGPRHTLELDIQNMIRGYEQGL